MSHSCRGRSWHSACFGRGRPRKVDELIRMLGDAGFVSIRVLPTRMPLQTSVLLARCPNVAAKSLM